MLRVTYTGGDAPQHWTFDPDGVAVDDAEQIEAAMGAGQTYDDFTRSLINATARARRVLLWYLMRRDHPDTRLLFSDVPIFKMGELVVELGTAELAVLQSQIEENDRITPERKRAALAAVAEEFAAAAMAEADRDVFAEAADPKDDLLAEALPVAGPPDPVMPDASTALAASPKSGKRSPTSSPRSAPRPRQ
jgi:hypothetical protein